MTNKLTVVKKKIGTVVKCGSLNTATVSVDRTKEHRLYHKKYTISTKFLCENPENKFVVGDLVEIVSGRPISKRKSYTIIKKVDLAKESKEGK